MTGIFDGVAGLLVDTFGGPVTVDPDGAAREVTGVLRTDPIEVEDQDGHVTLAPRSTLRVTRDAAEWIVTGAIVAREDGARFRIVNQIATGSPASDRLIVYELESADA